MTENSSSSAEMKALLSTPEREAIAAVVDCVARASGSASVSIVGQSVELFPAVYASEGEAALDESTLKCLVVSIQLRRDRINMTELPTFVQHLFETRHGSSNLLTLEINRQWFRSQFEQPDVSDSWQARARFFIASDLTLTWWQDTGGATVPFAVADLAADNNEAPTRDLIEQLLAMPKGRSRIGFAVERTPITAGRVYPPSFEHINAQLRLSDYGGAIRLLDAFDIVPSVDVGVPLFNPHQPHSEVRLISGRDVIADAERLTDDREGARTQDVAAQSHLKVGDVVLRAVFRSSEDGGWTYARVTEGDLPAAPTSTVHALRAKSTITPGVANFILAFLSSPLIKNQGLGSQLSGSIRIAGQDLRQVVVPIPDDVMHASMDAAQHAQRVALEWAAEARHFVNRIFVGPAASANRKRAIVESRALRARISAGELTQTLSYRVRTHYPLPLAARWRSLDADLSFGTSRRAYLGVLDVAETLTAVLAAMALSLSKERGLSLGAAAEIRSKLGRGQGPTFGDWIAVLSEIGGRRAKAVREIPGADELCAFLDNVEARDSLNFLVGLRNDNAHGRGIEDVDLSRQTTQALIALQFLLDRASFLEDLPILLVRRLKWDSLEASGTAAVSLLAGDHPVVATETMQVARPDLEVDSLYLLDQEKSLHLLRPFMVAANCPKCSVLSTFHIDLCQGDRVQMKSFEHGHPAVDLVTRAELARAGLFDRPERSSTIAQ